MTRLPYNVRPLGRWKWPSILLVTLVPVAFYFGSWRPSLRPAPFGTSILGPSQIGPWVVVVGTDEAIPIRGERVTFRVRFCDGCYDVIRIAEIGFGDANGPFSGQLVRLTGDANSLGASLVHPGRRAPLYLWMLTRDWESRVHSRSWRVR